jgi:hypothetical protein
MSCRGLREGKKMRQQSHGGNPLRANGGWCALGVSCAVSNAIFAWGQGAVLRGRERETRTQRKGEPMASTRYGPIMCSESRSVVVEFDIR